MSNSIKEQISEELKKASSEGKIRAERVKEIVKTAVSSAIAELQEGSVEINSILKESVNTVMENIKDKGAETKEEITASIEGVIEAITQKKRQEIVKSQRQIEQLQAEIDEQEKEIEIEIDSALTNLETSEKDVSDNTKEAIASAISTIRDSEEVTLMRKRYAQLQTQISVLKANITARYGENYEQVKKHLDDAKTWHKQTVESPSNSEENQSDLVQQKQAEFEKKIGEAGVALAKKERHLVSILKDLWQSINERISDKNPPSK